MRVLQKTPKTMVPDMDNSTDNTRPTDKLGNGRTNGARNVPARASLPKPDDNDNGSIRDLGSLAEVEADQPAGMELDQSATTDPITWNPQHSLDMRLFLAQGEVHKLEKDVTVAKRTSKDGKTYGGYSGISADQVVAVAKSALRKHGILYKSQLDKGTVKRNGNKTELWIDGTFSCVDKPDDAWTKGAWGEGNDNAAHGYQKATTNAEKIILGKALLMTTVEDESEPIETIASIDNAAVKEAEALTQAAIKSWADNFKRALDHCPDLKELKRIRAENAHMMKSDQVPQVTKDYFVTTIAQLEGDLTE